MNSEEKPFFVGYLEKAPAPIATFLKPRIAFLLLIATALGLILAYAQSAFAPSVFEFGTYRHFEGTLLTEPYPMLLVDRPNSETKSHYFVVAFGKRGGQETLEPFHGQRVRLQGQLIFRGDQTMLEFKDGSIETIASGTTGSAPTVISEQVSLRGEIVDSKCYLGVMKPGEGKTHKACAIRCIAGGIPPVFVVKLPDGRTHHLLLTDPQGGAVNQAVLSYVAEPVEITGRLTVTDDLYMLKADPASYRRLP